MTEEQMIDCLLYELVKKDKAIKKKSFTLLKFRIRIGKAEVTPSLCLKDKVIKFFW